MNQNHIYGAAAEAAVVKLLQADDFTILEQNYTKFFGEIDIIAQKEDVIVFVEVKARNNPKLTMLGLITPSKQRKVIQTARDYIARNNKQSVTYRFDVALVHGDNDITYIPNAFNQREGL